MPKCPFHAFHRDGAMRVDGNHGGISAYEPNSHNEWQKQPDFREPPLAINGAANHLTSAKMTTIITRNQVHCSN